MNSKSYFKTLVIIDLETTGLVFEEPKITELAMIAVNIGTLEQMKDGEELPRILNKFVKFFNPTKLLRATIAEMTGLTNAMLMDYVLFNRETVHAMEAFLSDFQKPMCFVAHNGNLFDFPILFNEIQSALSSPSCFLNSISNTNDNCNDHTSINITDDDNSIGSLKTKNSSTQTMTPNNNDHDQTSLFSIACADSLVFFREIHRLLNDKEVVDYSIGKISTTSQVTSNQNQCENEQSFNMIEANSSFETSTTNNTNTHNNNNNNNHSSTSHHGYVEIPIKYIPSQDPERQRLSMKLVKIYEREFNQTTSQLKSHRAEDDCLMLLAIIKRYLPDWLEWIDLNNQPLSNFSTLPLATPKQTSPKNALNAKRPLKF